MFEDQAFLESVVKAIVANPSDVTVNRTIDEMGVLLTLKINPADMGYIIGRKGQTAQAIRTLLRIVGAKNNARVNLKIYEPEGARQARHQEVRPESTDKLADVDTSALDDLSI